MKCFKIPEKEMIFGLVKKASFCKFWSLIKISRTVSQKIVIKTSINPSLLRSMETILVSGELCSGHTPERKWFFLLWGERWRTFWWLRQQLFSIFRNSYQSIKTQLQNKFSLNKLDRFNSMFDNPGNDFFSSTKPSSCYRGILKP